MALRHITRPEGETVPDLYDFVDYLLREYHHSEPFEDRISSDAILTPLKNLDEEGRLKVSVMLSRLAGKIATESLESIAPRPGIRRDRTDTSATNR